MNHLGYSVYISTFWEQKAFLERIKNKETFIFTSLHIAEEVSENYIQQANEMLKWVNAQGFKVIGDVSKRTLALFHEPDMVRLAKKLGLYMIRIDYGFEEEEMIALAKNFPIVFNASTVDRALARKLKQVSKDIFAIHNYYPREYTGLSYKQFMDINKSLQQESIQVLGFIPNHKKSRGPIYEGLPSIEAERYLPSAISYLEMCRGMAIDGILLSDLALEPLDQYIIEVYETTGIISLPCTMEEAFKYLYDQVFTIRIDSPECAYRLQESREFATQGPVIEPLNCLERIVGSITCDNKHYGRYSGEIQIIRESLPKDYRVNVIGRVAPEYIKMVQVIENGQKIKFIKSSN